MIDQRDYSWSDRFCLGVDQMVRALTGHPQTTGAPYPAKKRTEQTLTETQRRHAAGLMRVNHAGEICAQALYHGQSVASRAPHMQDKWRQAAIEEGDHLCWCQQRLGELGSHTSYLNPLWYAGSFCIGMAAGMVGDAWSLGFVAETERQVIQHLAEQRELLPKQDKRSYHILKQMEKDEAIHRDAAITAGAHNLPPLVQQGMNLMAKIMVKLAYWL